LGGGGIPPRILRNFNLHIRIQNYKNRCQQHLQGMEDY